MDFTLILIGLIWGAGAGYLLVRAVDPLLGMLFCLSALVRLRWRRLAKKSTAGLVGADTLLGVMFWIGVQLLLFCGLLMLGDHLVHQGGVFRYQGAGVIAFALPAGAVVLVQLQTVRRRVTTAWKMSHEYDFAERRKRTRVLGV